MEPEHSLAAGWPFERLAELLERVSTAADDTEALNAAVERAADAVHADLAGIARDDRLACFTGDADPERCAPILATLSPGEITDLELPGLGRCTALSASIAGSRGDELVVARRGYGSLGPDDLMVIRSVAHTLAMGLKLIRSLAEERTLRHRTETEMKVRKQVESNYKNLVERLPAIVYTAEMGEMGAWRYVSPQIEDILGYTPEEWISDPDLWSKCLFLGDRDRALEQESEKVVGDRNPPPIDYRMVTRDGEVRWILDEAVLERDADGVPVWHGVLYDITERKQAEESLQRLAAQQAAIVALGERALEGAESSALMDMAVELITGTEGVQHGCIWELPSEGRTVRLRAGLGDQREGSQRVSAGRDSHAAAALDSGLHVIVDDWTSESRFSMPPALRVLDVRSSLAVVIDGKHKPFGVLDVHSTAPSRFTPQDVHFVQAVANVLADAIERRAADEELRYRVLHDSLTGLPNRLLFVDTLGEALDRAADTGSPVGVLFLDLDHFKLINDSLGHHKGDELLRAVAPRLRAHLRPGDTVARFGGDEFGILVEHLTDEREAIAIADRVGAAFDRPFRLGGVEHFVSSSIGIAVARPGDDADADSLIRDADAAMYRAKDGGRARSVLFDADMRARAVQRLETERELRLAVDKEELTLHYQPIVSLHSGEVIGAEALVRWQHPERGLLQPGEFIPVAEDSGLIESIGRWVAEQACEQTVTWQHERPDSRPLDISVNLSARQVTHRELPAIVAETLARTGLDASSLHLEITESVLVEESEAVTATLEALSELGVTLVLDDFGTGYSSLAYLNRFPLDALKIDRSFTEALGMEQERTAIVEAIIAMARALSLDVIAEGVENAEQLSELRRLGCDYAQGFYFSRPISTRQFERVIDETAPYSVILPGR